MPQPVLSTQRMLLVPLDDRHLRWEQHLDSDPDVLRYISGRAHTRAEVARSHATRMELTRRVEGLGYWVAYGTEGGRPGSHRPSDENAGAFLGLLMVPPAHGPDQPDDPTVADLGYRFARRYWRQGLATEACHELLRHAFDTVHMQRVIAQTMAVNNASRAVMHALGMRLVRSYYPSWDDPLPGSELGEVEYEITRTTWQSRR